MKTPRNLRDIKFDDNHLYPPESFHTLREAGIGKLDDINPEKWHHTVIKLIVIVAIIGVILLINRGVINNDKRTTIKGPAKEKVSLITTRRTNTGTSNISGINLRQSYSAIQRPRGQGIKVPA